MPRVMPWLLAVFPVLLEELDVWVIFLSPDSFFFSLKDAFIFLKHFKLKFFRKEKQVRHGVTGWVLQGRVMFNLAAQGKVCSTMTTLVIISPHGSRSLENCTPVRFPSHTARQETWPCPGWTLLRRLCSDPALNDPASFSLVLPSSHMHCPLTTSRNVAEDRWSLPKPCSQRDSTPKSPHSIAPRYGSY